jgi:hypothetical protein
MSVVKCLRCVCGSSNVFCLVAFLCISILFHALSVMLNEFNKAQPTIKFTTEKELHDSINFLDLTIHS